MSTNKVCVLRRMMSLIKPSGIMNGEFLVLAYPISLIRLFLIQSFRRRRFHWPSEAPEWDLAPTESLLDSTPKSAKSSAPRTSSGSNADPTAPRKLSDSPHGPYMCDELTHVRTIRIYEAVKTDDYSLASLPFPRSPAPSPPEAQS